ncbi:hypothetical protein MKW92_051762 [Papaver armeniacum]|nr:hypothetical protein MKW92_051762 [Papaver armeniacum]
MIAGYFRNEKFKDTIELYHRMRSLGLKTDSFTCTLALKACSSLSDVESGKIIMRNAMENGLASDRFLGSSMIKFLVKFGDIDEARSIFDELPCKDVVCWNSIIGGYVQNGNFHMALNLFWKMLGGGIIPTQVSIASLTQACGGIGNLELGKCVHGFLNSLGMGFDILVLTSLVDMYCKIGDVESARRVFDRMPTRNLISWNAMISGYVHNGFFFEGFELFRRLVLSGCDFDSVTIVSLLQGSAQLSSLDNGKVLHGFVLRRGLQSNFIVSTAIVDLYAKCGDLKLASSVFTRIKVRNVISWTAMLMGLAQNGHAEESMRLFGQMQEEGVVANVVTLVSLIHACAHVGSLKKGTSVHGYLIRYNISYDEVVRTALIDMYAKCGKLDSAKRVFDGRLKSSDVVLWNSMITGYGIHGRGDKAIDVFNQMKTEDLLSRAGRLEEAEALINQMPFAPGNAVLEALLSGCRTHKKIEMGIRTADKLLILDSMNPGIHVILSNIYALGGRWNEVDYVRGLMRKRGLRKTPGYSLLEVNNLVHTFFAGDNSHPYWEEIHQMLEDLRIQIETLGYCPDTSCVLRDVDEEKKVKLLWCHSERLAMAFALLCTPAGSLIRITKNLRVCSDCHTVTKYISRIARREIIVRDANRFHHFDNGKCSCGDYW